MGSLRLHLGGILAGTRRLGREYYLTEASDGAGYLNSGIDVYQNEIQWADTWGVKSRLQGTVGRLLVHLQASYLGLVADGGPDATESHFTLKESGRGNHYAVEAGAYTGLGDVSFGPKVLYQMPLVGPIDPVAGALTNGIIYPRVPLRNVLDDPFVVRNRETVAAHHTCVRPDAHRLVLDLESYRPRIQSIRFQSEEHLLAPSNSAGCAGGNF